MAMVFKRNLANVGNTETTILRSRSGDRLNHDLYIFAQTAAAHSPVSSSRLLASQYKVSLSTVQRILRQMIQEGFFYAEARSGYFVAERQKASTAAGAFIYVDAWETPGRPYCMNLLRGLSEEAHRRGLRLEVAPYRETDIFPMIARPEVKGLIMPRRTGTVCQALEENPNLRVVFTEYPVGMPPEGSASVSFDAVAAGQIGLRYLAEAGCRKIACVDDGRPFFTGARAYVEAKKLTGVELCHLRSRAGVDNSALAAAIREGGHDGLLCYDDHTAARILSALSLEAPELAQSLRLAAHANRGEPLLPPQAARLEIDPVELGAVVVSTLEMLCQNPRRPGMSVGVGPRLILPGAKE